MTLKSIAKNDSSVLEQLAFKHYAPGAVSRKPKHYLEEYERRFASQRFNEIRILEIGVDQGASARIWREFMPNSYIAGIDMNPRPDGHPNDDRTFFVQALQDDPVAIAKAAAFVPGGQFDVVIDDCSHMGHPTMQSFKAIFPDYVPSGGTYVIEDFGAPTIPYWWEKDGAELTAPATSALKDKQFPSYDFGTIGALKQLIDFLMLPETGCPERLPIADIHIFRSIAFLTRQ